MIMTLPEQWKYLNKMAEQMRCSGNHEECQKLLQCSATIKDIWIDAHREMMDSLGQGEQLFYQKVDTVKRYQTEMHKAPEIFQNEK